MQTWNSVCGAGGNPNNRKLEGPRGAPRERCPTVDALSRVALHRSLSQTCLCQDQP